MKGLWLSGISAAILGLSVVPASAQNVIGAKSGVINWIEGDVFLGDKPYVMQPSQFGEVKENMILRTEEGRAEVLLPPGVFFRIAEKSSFKMISNRLIDTRVELLTGSAIMEIDDLAKEATVTLVCKNGTVSLTKPGLYRFDTQPAQVKVFKGVADIAMAGQDYSVPAGKMLLLGGTVASVEKFNVEDTDSFDHWSRRRGEVLADANISAAKQANGYGSGSVYGGINPCYGYGTPGIGIGIGTPGIGTGVYGTGPYVMPLGTWGYNPYYGMGTYIPCQGTMMSPYGFQYWSPFSAYQAFFSPNPLYTWNPARGGALSPSSATSRGLSKTSNGLSSGSGGTFSRGGVSGVGGSTGSVGSSGGGLGGAASAGHGGSAGAGHGK